MDGDVFMVRSLRQHPAMADVFGHQVDQLKEALETANATIAEQQKRIAELEARLAVECRRADKCVTMAELRVLMGSAAAGR